MSTSFGELYRELTANDMERFKIVTRRLMKNTFVVKDKNDISRADYAFITKNSELYEKYLRYMGFFLQFERDEGIIKLCSEENNAVNRYNFTAAETMIYIVFFLMYYENRRENYGYTRYVDVTKIDIIHALDKYGVRKAVEKQLAATIDRFDQKSLIRKNEDFREENGSVRLYGSLAMGLNLDEAARVVDILRSKYRMDSNNGNAEIYTEPEEEENEMSEYDEGEEE